jgi:phosphoglycolate phosphatase-like HAD superfamily hydrolase
MNIWLFDLDGVLVHPGGYREALRRTVAHFSRRAGYPDAPLAESVIEAFEAHGITCEWDIAGICLMAEVLDAWRADPSLRLPADLDGCLQAIRESGVPRRQPDYARWARQAGAMGGETPSESAVRLFAQEAGHTDAEKARLDEFRAVLEAVLGHPREFARSPVMRFFQQYTLGSRAYAEHYRTEPTIDTPSLLAERDRPGLSEAPRDRILQSVSEGDIRAAVITARPCRPQSTEDDLTDYPPEAEIALEVAGVKALPLAGAGHMQWLARRHGQAVDGYLKPSPVHSLAAIAFALGSGEGDALEAARSFVEEGQLLPALANLKAEPSTVKVFEDSPTGVIGTQSAVDLLRRARIDIRLRIFGVASGEEKRAALESLGAGVFPATDEALEAAWEEE